MQVIHTCTDDTHRAGDQLLRPAASRAVFRHVRHFAMEVVRQPFIEPRFVLTQVGIAYAQFLKTEFLTPALNLVSQIGKLVLLQVGACRGRIPDIGRWV